MELKPCPFCGCNSAKVRIIMAAFKYSRNNTYRVKCGECDSYGPGVNIPFGIDVQDRLEAARKEAADLWNRSA